MKKLSKYFTIGLWEFRAGTTKILASVFFLISVISISLSLLSVSESCTKNYQEDLAIKHPDGIILPLNLETEEQAEKLKELGFVNFFANGSYFTRNCYLTALDRTVSPDDISNGSDLSDFLFVGFNNTGIITFFEDNNNLSALIKEGEPPGKNSNNKSENSMFPIYLNYETAQALKLSAGDIVYHKQSIIAPGYPFYVAGIFFAPNPVFAFSANAFFEMEKHFKNNYIYYSATLPDILTIFDVNNELKNSGIKISSYESEIEYICNIMFVFSLLEKILLIISALSFVFGLFITFNHMRMLVDERIKAIGIYKALGFKEQNIVFVFFLIMIAIISVAVISATVLAIILNNYAADVFLNLFQYRKQINFDRMLPLYIFGCGIIVSAFSCLFLYTKIRKIPVSGIMADSGSK